MVEEVKREQNTEQLNLAGAGSGATGTAGGGAGGGAGDPAKPGAETPRQPGTNAEKPKGPGGSKPADPSPPRSDSFRCPSCGAYGCPTVGGTKLTDRGVNRYRVCSTCKKKCITLTPFGSINERVVASNYGGPIEGPAKT